MHTISPERAAQLKAEAITARRAARAPWQNAHVDRLAREREARRIAREFRVEQQTTEGRQCRQCGQTLPAAAFELLPSGGLRSICRDCRTAQKVARKRAARAAYQQTPEYQAELERRRLEREQRQEDREATKAERERARLTAEEAERTAACEAAIARRRKREARKRGIGLRPLSAEQQREVAERIPHLVALLTGTSDFRHRISDQQTWEATASELKRLWLQSGDKECKSCGAVVSAAAMRPPGPANFYPGKCNSCASAEHLADHRRVFGGELEGPRRIAMLDGPSITVAQLARRHRDRERAYRLGQSRLVFEHKSEAA